MAWLLNLPYGVSQMAVLDSMSGRENELAWMLKGRTARGPTFLYRSCAYFGLEFAKRRYHVGYAMAKTYVFFGTVYCFWYGGLGAGN